MRKATILFACLLLLVVIMTGCGDDEVLEPEEKDGQLRQVLEERGIESIDEELTAAIMAEEKVKYAYFADQDDTIAVYIAFVSGTDDSELAELSKQAKEMAEEKYPGYRVTVDGSVDVE